MMVGGCGLVWDQGEIGIAEGPLVFHSQTSYSDRTHAAQTLSTP